MPTGNIRSQGAEPDPAFARFPGRRPLAGTAGAACRAGRLCLRRLRFFFFIAPPLPRIRDPMETEKIRSKCRGVRKRPAGFCQMPRPDDPRGSRHDGGQSETRPRVKLDYRATTPRS